MGKLGVGGSGIVYKARDTLLQRYVAVKVLSSPKAAEDKTLLRLQQEARAAAALSHPGIVTVHEFARSDDGQAYLVMDYVEGIALSELISTQAHISHDRCAAIAEKLADALAYAHQNGVVHRDLKPSNIMLIAQENKDESVKIVDFGIAKITTPDQGQSLTQTGEVFGSPLYMSPEQCLGQKVDQRSDIYSLGCVMYELLTGDPPFIGANVLDTIQLHINSPPKQIRSTKEAPIDSIVYKMLAKDPANRHNQCRMCSESFSALIPAF